MIGVATTVFDIGGDRVFAGLDKEVNNRSGARRVTRTATLDGGASVADMGYSDSDREINIIEPEASIASAGYARYICENYARVVVSTLDGAYEAVPVSHGLADGELTLKLLVVSKISE